jgi:hypothetical protein
MILRLTTREENDSPPWQGGVRGGCRSLTTAQASRLSRHTHFSRTAAGEMGVRHRPSRRGEVIDVTIHVWYLRNLVMRRRKAKIQFIANGSLCYFGERHGSHPMKLSDTSCFIPKLRAGVRRILRMCSEEGDALFEFAMILPLLSMLLVGIIYGGITFYDYVTLANAVEVGARTIATNRGAGAGPPTACTLGETALTNAATNLKSGLITIDSGPSTESFTGSGGSTCNALVAGDYVTVSATYPCSLTIPFAKINLCPVQNAGSSYISSTTTMRIE